MLVMDKSGSIFEERRDKTKKFKNVKEVENDRRKKDINANKKKSK
jgi:hypothetical protein